MVSLPRASSDLARSSRWAWVGTPRSSLRPGGSELLSRRETAALRRQAAVLFIDVLLIAYPLAILASMLGTVVLIWLLVRARSHQHREGAQGSPKSPLRARLLLLCVSTMLSLAAFEAGAALWRLKLHQSARLIGGLAAARSVCVMTTCMFRTNFVLTGQSCLKDGKRPPPDRPSLANSRHR